ncbi:hypothetical protein Hanom_Chr09g00848031 [Helianthus anomalus]
MMRYNASVRVIRDPNWLRKRLIIFLAIFLCSGYSPVVRLDSNPLKRLSNLLSVVINIFSDTIYSASVRNISSCFGTSLVS